MYPRYFLFIISFLLSIRTLYAQTFYGQHELSVSYGILTLQHNLTSGFESGLATTGDPKSQLVMGMLSYRYYTGGCSSVGITAGINKFTAEGEYDYGRYLDFYTYTYTTVAGEFTLNYLNRKYFRGYGYLGAGISFFTVKDNRYISARNVYEEKTDRHSSFNGQFVPFGISVGGKLAAFIELGIGYKGAIHGGIPYRFDVRKPISAFNHAESKKAVVVYGNYDVDGNWKYLGKIKSHGLKYDRDLSLEHQVEKLSVAATKDSANVIMLDRILKWPCNGCFWLRADAWRAPDADSFKAAIQDQEKVDFGDKNYSYIIIYRMDVHPACRDKIGYLYLDSSDRFEIKNNAKYIFKVSNEGWVTLVVPGMKPNHSYVKVEKGKKYYYKGEVRLNSFKSKLALKRMKERVGEIESNNHTIVYRINI